MLKKDFRRKKRKGGKLDHRWLGPYTISADCGKGFYTLNGANGVAFKRINGAHLKVYYGVTSDVSSCILSCMLYMLSYKLNAFTAGSE